MRTLSSVSRLAPADISRETISLSPHAAAAISGDQPYYHTKIGKTKTIQTTPDISYVNSKHAMLSVTFEYIVIFTLPTTVVWAMRVVRMIYNEYRTASCA